MSSRLKDPLNDMQCLAAGIEACLDGLSEEDLVANQLLRETVASALSMLWELLADLEDDLKARHPEISWDGIPGFPTPMDREAFDNSPHKVAELTAKLAAIKAMLRKE